MLRTLDFHLDNAARHGGVEALDDDALGCCRGIIRTGRVVVGMEDPSAKSELLGDAYVISMRTTGAFDFYRPLLCARRWEAENAGGPLRAWQNGNLARKE